MIKGTIVLCFCAKVYGRRGKRGTLHMRKIYTWITGHRKTIMIFFFAATVLCALLKGMVSVNYDINEYLPEDSPSTVSLQRMQEEFSGDIPNARVMVRGVTIPEALQYKEKLRQVGGVTDVTWLDDAVDITLPLAALDEKTVETYYKDSTALFSVTIAEHSRLSAVDEIRGIIGDENAMSGSAVSTAASTVNTVSEVRLITIVGVLLAMCILFLTTKSWLEPVLVIGGLGIAVILNAGTNLIFGEISFVTNAAGSVLQMAVSMDYSIFLIHRFEECRKEIPDVCQAMVEALCKSTSAILSSGLTTVIGFLALVLMQFRIGPDLGLALAKGVAISLLTVFVFMPALILSTYKLQDKTRHRAFLPSFRALGKAVQRMAIPMACLFALILCPAYLASTANSYYYGSSHTFDAQTQTGADAAAIEAVFGEQDTYVLLVPNGDLATQQAVSDALHDLPQITGIISYVDTVGAEIPPEYLDSDTLAMLQSDQYSRMVLSVEVPYEGEETFRLVQQVRDIAQQYYPDSYYLAGSGVSTYDLMQTVTADMTKVNLVAIAAVFLVLVLTMRSVCLPVILVLSIETAIWMNLAVPYFMGSQVFYIAYLITSSIQLGATVDYAILMTDRYRENRRRLEKKAAVVETRSNVTVSILPSGSVLTVVGLLIGFISTNQLLSQLGIFIGRGAIFSMVIVLLVLPGLLYLFDRLVTGRKHRNSSPEQATAIQEGTEK